MSRDDLALCWLPHATSKIEHEDDLLRVDSLGFRGEALSSIAHVARMTIVSRGADAPVAHRLEVRDGELVDLVPATGAAGTVVDVADLFFAYPARRRFLRRPQAETNACRQIVVDRALAFPELAFRFFVEGSPRLLLPPANRIERVVQALMEPSHAPLLSLIETRGEGFSVEIVLGDPSLFRRDRRRTAVFVNGRRISDFGLLQAVEHGYAGFLAGGLFPVAFVFVRMDPSLVDFNIHPAKKEARFRNYGELHHQISTTVAAHLRARSKPRTLPPSARNELFSEGLPFGSGGRPQSFGGAVREDGDRLRAAVPRHPMTIRHGASTNLAGDTPPGDRPRYLGSVASLFLVAEYRGGLLIVDQHAAHERLLFDRLRSAGGRNGLLVPASFELDEEASEALRRARSDLAAVGLELEEVDRNGGTWELRSLPEGFSGTEAVVISAIRELAVSPRELEGRLFADIACKAAVKDGDYLDMVAATRIIEGVLALEEPRCPHGRPIYRHIDAEELLTSVGREPDGRRPHQAP